MQSEKTRTDIHWNATDWATLEKSSTPRRQTYTRKQVLRNMTENDLLWAALLSRNRDWTNINAHPKMQLGPTSSRISSTTFPNFKLHICDYHCSTTCQSDLGRLNPQQSSPMEAGVRVQTLLGPHSSRPKPETCLGWEGPLEKTAHSLLRQSQPPQATLACLCLSDLFRTGTKELPKLLRFPKPSIKGPWKEKTPATAVIISEWVNEDLDDYNPHPHTHWESHIKAEKKQSQTKLKQQCLRCNTEITMTSENGYFITWSTEPRHLNLLKYPI